jgi:hypothetical protein
MSMRGYPRRRWRKQLQQASGLSGYHTDRRSATDCRPFHTYIPKPVFAASICKSSGLFIGPAMASVTPGIWFCPPLHRDQTAMGRRSRRTSRSPASMSDQWCTVAIDHTT